MAYRGNSWEKKINKITFQSCDNVMSWESPYWDEPIENIIRGFCGLLVADGYSESSVHESFFDYLINNMDNPEIIYDWLDANNIKTLEDCEIKKDE